ncbi:WD40 repeat-like protein [Annulohypoxylon maeteangense]|uniref:WD40 repeat-like protein n=1 Tax=Annulohypoxylon maeteangense TaxID=1927788 RepID=UPI002007E842|nr:WD40 repeat-like protein [Annulohypoxylon maeteangense]KAI0880151.1 WD40 repeat-like protein [Annulohypoxylon maeteangense]
MPIASPDRFVPFRVPLGERFRATKQAHELSPSERLYRTDDASSDVFCFTPKRSSPVSSRRASRSDSNQRRLGTILSLQSLSLEQRQVSNGAVWSVGGLAPGGIDDGHGRRVSSGTNARLYATSFSNVRPKSEEDQEKHEGRLALALKIDRVQRILDFDGYSTFPSCKHKKRPSLRETRTTWTGSEWSNDRHIPKIHKEERCLPNAPFKVLDAPGLRDDFYCSIMAYSRTCNTLAVGLGNLLYGWSESSGVTLLNAGLKDGSWLTSVAFSSEQGGKSILAFGRSSGLLSLVSLFDSLLPRFEAYHPEPIACLSWRPASTSRPSLSKRNPGVLVKTEDLLEVARENWRGAITLLARIKVHSQQICGLAWSLDGEQFATGGNDNLCCLFHVSGITDTEPCLSLSFPKVPMVNLPCGEKGPLSPFNAGDGASISSPVTFDCPSPLPAIKHLPAGSEKHRWRHGAAVKAIAFCPWHRGLIATGGGSNDKCIHFYHTNSGAALATISVAAQVTSLIWSTTRREIAATFGYAQPDHPYRIAVFSWPDCRQVAAERLKSRTAEEGCIIVASSDESVKFHEVWAAGRKATTFGSGVLARSDILEMGEGIDKEGDVIR